MPVFLDALSIQNFRGIGPETQYIEPFSEMNFFVGPNNAGKSIILNCLHDRLPFSVKTEASRLNAASAEIYLGANSGEFAVAVGIPTQQVLDHLKGRSKDYPLGRNSILTALDVIVESIQHHGHIWVKAEQREKALLHEPAVEEAAEWMNSAYWREFWGWITNSNGGSLLEHWVPQSLSAFGNAVPISLPKCMLIPAKRQLGPKDQTFDDLSGKGLIDHLAQIQNPDHHERHRKEVFVKINAFVRAVTGKSDAVLEVPYNRENLLVRMDNKELPLASLGTGIHEVILIAAFCTIHQDVIMCIEEPEIHLHPVLQRKLIHYLQENTSNQYFIATHSATFIDMHGASVFRVHNDGTQTYVRPALVKSDRRALVDELGYRASDIVQANAVVWVEGPSDRIYVRHWLHHEAPELIEGIDYSIVFYGGGLLKHLSADDDSIDDFIKLRELNRNLAVIIDSDKASAQAKLKPAALRIKNEMSDGGGLVWITKGREIENYVDPELLQSALKSCHPKIYKAPDKVGPYDHAFYFERNGSKQQESDIYKSGDKVGVALKVCEQLPDITRLDLKERLRDLVALIQRANE